MPPRGFVYWLLPASLVCSVELASRLGWLPTAVGLRYAFGVAWLTLVVGETIAASSGIGYLAMDAREFMRTDIIVLSVLIYALLGASSDGLGRLLERRFLRWHPNYSHASRV
jgi:sulfonate transport system permease protein